MEAADNEVTTNIVKGKRTKRQRVQSPICFALTTNSSSIDGDGGNINDAIAGDCDSGSGRDDYTNGKISTNISLATSFQEFHYQDSTEEEEDVANCLILLAQCHSKDHSPKQDTEHDNISAATAGVYNATNISNTTGGGNSNKFNSRRFLETGSSGSGKAGYYVYECKTCCRTFPSFQALGGHRASHKKPKGIHNNDEKKQLTVSSDEEDGHYKDISSLSLQLSNNNNNNNRGARVYINHHQSKAKIHECSICGAEFTSGQALGGHMRRHRAPVGAAATASTTTSNTNLSLTPMAVESEEPKKARNLISLDLDLNLPAPDDERQAFASKQQQQQQKQDQQQKSPLVFSGPTLVDCHY